jgi:hypothetical protein
MTFDTMRIHLCWKAGYGRFGWVLIMTSAALVQGADSALDSYANCISSPPMRHLCADFT